MSFSTPNRLDLHPVGIFTLFDLKRIRNDCRGFMTHSTKEIGNLQQIKWYIKYLLRFGKDTCFVAYFNGDIVGYGYLREIKEKVWISGGLITKARGLGLGTELFKHLTLLGRMRSYPKNEVWLDVLRTNKIAVHIYKDIGYKRVHTYKDIIVMKYE